MNGIKCTICRNRHVSANNCAKFTCNKCRNFLIAQGHYYVAGERLGNIIESIDSYTVRLGEVLDIKVGA